MKEEDFDKLYPATDEEEDMLDLAFGLTETSRLGCQIIMSQELNGIRVRLPASSRNVSGWFYMNIEEIFNQRTCYNFIDKQCIHVSNIYASKLNDCIEWFQNIFMKFIV